ncbi:MAG: FG-GAP-like repeat-containing protein [Planctomycetota bacterium]|nr:FG-GAP-like repeat-containing protein [Planctomycetota bacterium]
MRRAALALVLVVAVGLIPGCGAGVISAGLLGSRNQSDPVAEPSITLSQGIGPLSIDADEFYVRRAILRNAQIPATADFEVLLTANVAGTSVEEVQTLLLVERTETEVSVGFALKTAAIRAEITDPTSEDVAAEIVVRIDGGESIFRAPFLLLRQPRATLVPNDPDRGISVVSVLGDELVLGVTGLPTRDPRDLTVEVVTGDPNPPDGQPGFLLRRASNLRTEADPTDPGRTVLRCTVPSSSVPTQALARVAHVTAGRSTILTDVYYRPELTAVAARRGGVDGGELVSLTGQGIVPFALTQVPPQPAFASVQVFIAKGGQEVGIAQSEFRPSLSSPNSLVFVTPPSPDGRPGPATLRLRVLLPVPIDVQRDGLFAYGATETELGPRGMRLDPADAAVGFGARASAAPGGTPLDAAIVAPDPSGVPVVRFLEAQGNGMFSPLGLRVRAGDRADLEQRDPLDVVFGAFGADAWSDVLVVNRGSFRSAHVVLRGQEDPSQPLRSAGTAFRTQPAPAWTHVGRFGADAIDDVLVVGRDDPRLQTEYATVDAAGQFASRRLFSQVIPPFEASALGDVDGDGATDLLFAAGGAASSIRILFGEAGPDFSERRLVDVSSVPELRSGVVVGVHAVGVGPDRTLVLVTEGGVGGPDPAIVHLPASAPRTYLPGSAFAVGLGPFGGSVTRALSSDLDGDGVDELVVARASSGLELHEWSTDRFALRSGAVGLDAVRTGRVTDLEAGPAVQGDGRAAVFVVHDQPIGGGVEARVSTLLVEPGLALADPRAQTPLQDAPRAVLVGDFEVAGSVTGELLVAFTDRLELFANDGLGQHTSQAILATQGILPSTLAGLWAGSAGGVPRGAVFLIEDGRVGVLGADGSIQISADSLIDGSGTLAVATRLAVGDVDADGRDDVVVLVAVERPSTGAIERQIALLRGVDGAFPFAVPVRSARTDVTGAAVDIALGDLAPTAVGPRRLEAVVAVGRDDATNRGLHFFRYVAGVRPEDDHFVVSVIDPGDARVADRLDPGLVRVADLDGDARDDLVVVSSTQDVVQVLRQSRTSTRVQDEGDVDPLVFAVSAEQPLPGGLPEALQLADFDGDGLADLVARVRSRASQGLFPLVLAVSNGLGGFTQVLEVPSEHLGAVGVGVSTGIGDVNADAIPDVVLGVRGDSGAVAPALRVLFGAHR